MKEKTFEELITEKFPDYRFADKHDWNMRKFSGTDMIEMMKQVREATIAECIQTAKEELGIMSDSYFIKCVKSLPTNSIKTDL